MIKKIIINDVNKKLNFYILENNILVEYYNSKQFINIGDIFIGRILYIYKGMNAIFLDIGYYKYGFLNYDDIGEYFLSFKKKKIIYNKNNSKNVKKVFKIGQYIIVQVIKNTLYNKGPKLTCKITLIGRYVILIPFNYNIYISKKINERIKKVNKINIPNNIGYLIRTLAINKKIKNIKFEFYILLKIWYKIFFKIKKKKIKKIYTNENIFYNLFKNKKLSYNKIICNNNKICKKLKLYLYIFFNNNKNTKIYYYNNNNNISILDKYGISKQKKILFNKNIYLLDGSNLIIEKTEALNVIDINSNMINNFNSFKVNMLAIKEIVRQIRLRNMGGIIIIDLIDIKGKKYKKKIYKEIKKRMEIDNINHKILPPSKFNLIEITREKKINNYYYYKKDYNNYKKKQFININNIEGFIYKYYSIKRNKRKKLLLYVHNFIGAYLKYGFYSYRLKWYFKFNTWISIITYNNRNILKYKFYNNKNKCIYADVVKLVDTLDLGSSSIK